MRRVERLLKVGFVAYQAIGLPYGDPIVIRPRVAREAEEGDATQACCSLRAIPPSLQVSHTF